MRNLDRYGSNSLPFVACRTCLRFSGSALHALPTSLLISPNVLPYGGGVVTLGCLHLGGCTRGCTADCYKTMPCKTITMVMRKQQD